MSCNKRDSKFLKGFRNFRVPESLTSDAILHYLTGLDCPRALTVWLLFKNFEHVQLSELEFDPLNYEGLNHIGPAYMATCFLAKFKRLKLPFEPSAKAKEKFLSFESKCKATNRRFLNLGVDPLFKGSTVWLHNAVIRKISRILGDFEWTEMFDRADWGPGASTQIKRRIASPQYKFQFETGITRDLYALLSSGLFEGCYPLWDQHLDLVKNAKFEIGNRVVTVPKNAAIDRVIAIEPGINLWFQLGVGNMIRERLLRCGIDLKDQGRNQLLSRIGSKTGALATIDLSSASDSISRLVVRELLPNDWYTVLDTCRSHFGALDNRRLFWEKFSSMGNGFTFQLESLIFYAISYCCTEYVGADCNNVSVYGDDIVVPVSAVQCLSEMLEFYGFTMNSKKSYSSSAFRESCGAHYVSGFDIKPIYLKDRLQTVLSVFRLANAIRRLAHRSCNFMACDSRFRPAFEHLVSSIPKALRLRVPETLGDVGLISNFDEATPSRARYGVEGYHVLTLVESARTLPFEGIGLLLSSLWTLSKKKIDPEIGPVFVSPTKLQAISEATGSSSVRVAAGNSAPIHEKVWRLRKSLVQQWYNLGPWV